MLRELVRRDSTKETIGMLHTRLPLRWSTCLTWSHSITPLYTVSSIIYSFNCYLSALELYSYLHIWFAEMVVARVRVDTLDAQAYAACFSAVFTCVKKYHPFLSLERPYMWNNS